MAKQMSLVLQLFHWFNHGEGVMEWELSPMRLMLGLILLAVMAYPVLGASRREVLFDVTLDMDADGKLDRAVLVLVGPGRDTTWDLSRGHYPLTTDDTVDLAIYLGAGDAPVDINKPPTILKKNIADREYAGWLQSLDVVNKRSLKVGWNEQPGSSHDLEERLTIVWRKGKFLVVGLDTFWENPNGIGNCQLNLSTGEGSRSEGEFPAPKPTFKAKVKPVPLETWSAKTWPSQCDQHVE
jgi:hypothetical protein